MTLIPCPECETSVSDRARACPKCGFPVAEEIGRALAEVTGFDNMRSVRQKLAANKLMSWSETYAESEGAGHGKMLASGKRFGGRHRTALIVGLATVIVIVQLAILLGVMYR